MKERAHALDEFYLLVVARPWSLPRGPADFKGLFEEAWPVLRPDLLKLLSSRWKEALLSKESGESPYFPEVDVCSLFGVVDVRMVACRTLGFAVICPRLEPSCALFS